LTEAQSLSRFDKARLYLMPHKLIEHFASARMHLCCELSQICGFLTRAKSKARNEISRSCCDLISAGIEEREPHLAGLELANDQNQTGRLLCVKPGGLPYFAPPVTYEAFVTPT
jgi:hypothetical protein